MQQSGERVIARSLRRYVDGTVLHLRIAGALLRRRDTPKDLRSIRSSLGQLRLPRSSR